MLEKSKGAAFKIDHFVKALGVQAKELKVGEKLSFVYFQLAGETYYFRLEL